MEKNNNAQEIQIVDFNDFNDLLNKILQIKIRNFDGFSASEIINNIKQELSHETFDELYDLIDDIKISFYKSLKNEKEHLKKRKLQGTDVNDSDLLMQLENDFKLIYNNIKEKNKTIIDEIQKQKEQNFYEKQKVLEKFKDFIKNDTFSEKGFINFYKEIVNQYFEPVLLNEKQQKEHDQNFRQLNSDLYYKLKENLNILKDFIEFNKTLKINVLKTLDNLIEKSNKVYYLLKNLQEAIRKWQIFDINFSDLTEEFSELLNELNELNGKFKKIALNIYERYEKVKEEERVNLQAKTILCEMAEAILENNYTSTGEWKKAERQIIDLQNRWKTIGQIPLSYEITINNRFRQAIEKFYQKKNHFLAELSKEEEKNLALKQKILERVEKLKDSTDWKNTTNEIIKLQEEWKKIGKVPYHEHQTLEKRFREACDTFFKRKKQHFENIKNILQDNLEKKQELLKKVKNFNISGNIDDDLERIRKIQKEWGEIGPVPQKDQYLLQEEYKNSLQKLLDKLNLDDIQKAILFLKFKVDEITKQIPNPIKWIQIERNKLANQLFKLENEIKVIENNICFFAKSKMADEIVKNFTERVESIKKERVIIKEQIKFLDQCLKDLNK